MTPPHKRKPPGFINPSFSDRRRYNGAILPYLLHDLRLRGRAYLCEGLRRRENLMFCGTSPPFSE